jgi:hypothetical protein
VILGLSPLPNVHQFPDGSQTRDVALMPQKCTSVDKYQKGVLRLSSVRRRHSRFCDWMTGSCAMSHGMGPVRSRTCVTRYMASVSMFQSSGSRKGLPELRPFSNANASFIIFLTDCADNITYEVFKCHTEKGDSDPHNSTSCQRKRHRTM